MRNHREARYLITPANMVWSLGAVLVSETRTAAKPRQAIGLDAKPGPSWATRQQADAAGAGGRRDRARRQLGA